MARTKAQNCWHQMPIWQLLSAAKAASNRCSRGTGYITTCSVCRAGATAPQYPLQEILLHPVTPPRNLIAKRADNDAQSTGGIFSSTTPEQLGRRRPITSHPATLLVCMPQLHLIAGTPKQDNVHRQLVQCATLVTTAAGSSSICAGLSRHA